MPQLAPVNWLFLFVLFWFIVVLGSSLIWWSFKTEYSLTGSTTSGPDNSVKTNPTKSWNW